MDSPKWRLGAVTTEAKHAQIQWLHCPELFKGSWAFPFLMERAPVVTLVTFQLSLVLFLNPLPGGLCLHTGNSMQGDQLSPRLFTKHSDIHRHAESCEVCPHMVHTPQLHQLSPGLLPGAVNVPARRHPLCVQDGGCMLRFTMCLPSIC